MITNIRVVTLKMRGDKCHPDRGKRVKIPLLPYNLGKKSANDAGPQQGHDKSRLLNSLFFLKIHVIHDVQYYNQCQRYIQCTMLTTNPQVLIWPWVTSQYPKFGAPNSTVSTFTLRCIVGCLSVVQLGGPDAWFNRVGPTKVEARKSFLSSQVDKRLISYGNTVTY